jgi:hypothetical protein
MPLKVFNRTTTQKTSSFTVSEAVLSFGKGGGKGTGLVFESAAIQYQQPFSKIASLGAEGSDTSKGALSITKIGAPPTGQLQIARMVGPGTITKKFLEVFGDACNVSDHICHLSTSANCEGNGQKSSGKIEMGGVLIGSIQASLTAQQPVLRASIGAEFDELTWPDGM